MTLIRSHRSKARAAARARRQSYAWAAQSGPVETTATTVAGVPVRTWPAKIAARCYWCPRTINLGEPIARLSVSARDGWYGCPECVAAARSHVKAEPP
jgi:hypothetical protein